MFKSIIAAVIVALCLYGCGQQNASGNPHAPKYWLVHGGTVITMDDERPIAEAMLIRGDEILRLGSKDELLALAPYAQEYDVEGKTILPGIVDSHVHVHQLGAESLKANLVGTETVAEMVTRLKAFFPNSREGEWLIGQGWDEGAWASKGYPDRAELDAAFPDNPVLLQSLHGFAGFYNGAALAVAGIDASTPEPEVGNILRRKDGSPTGVFLTLARNLVEDKAPPPSNEQIKAAILSGLNTMAAKGVTSIHEAGITPEKLAAFQELAEEKRLPIRVYGLLDGNDDALMARMFANGPIIDPDHMLTVRSIKVFYDGSLGSRTALLKEPYSDHPELANPTERISPERVKKLAEQAAEHGFQMAVHTIGDEGNNRILDIYEDSLKPHPDFNHRWRLEHAQVVLSDFYSRVAKGKIISSMQPSHAVGDSGWAEDRVGGERIKHAYAWRRIKDAGGMIIFNSDLPGEPWEPMQTLYFAVTRAKLDAENADGWYADQAFTVEESLKAMTTDGAFAAFQEEHIGQLKPGMKADFIELSDNPMGVDATALKDIRVIGTWVSGEKLSLPQ